MQRESGGRIIEFRGCVIIITIRSGQNRDYQIVALALDRGDFHIGSGIAGFGRLCLVGVDVCHQISAGFDDGVRIRYFAGADGVVLLGFLVTAVDAQTFTSTSVEPVFLSSTQSQRLLSGSPAAFVLPA